MSTKGSRNRVRKITQYGQNYENIFSPKEEQKSYEIDKEDFILEEEDGIKYLSIVGDAASMIAEVLQLPEDSYVFSFSKEFDQMFFCYEGEHSSYEFVLNWFPKMQEDIKKDLPKRQKVVDKLESLGLSPEEIDLLNYEQEGAYKQKQKLKNL
jgi:hypothetical protein